MELLVGHQFVAAPRAAPRRFQGGVGRVPHARTYVETRRGDVGARATPTTRKLRGSEVDPETGFVMTKRAYDSAFSTFRQPGADVARAEVRGTLPAWLRGSYIRDGPGIFDGMLHLFDGYGLLVKVSFDDQGAAFHHRFIESEAYKSYRSTGRMKWREFGTPLPLDSALSAAQEVLRTLAGVAGLADAVTDNASVHVVPWDTSRGTGLAMSETFASWYEFDPRTLQTVGRVKFDRDDVRGTLTTAHPHVLPTGEYLNIANDPSYPLTVFRYAPGSRPHRMALGSVPHRRFMAPSWVHAFPCSSKWVVVPQFPAYFNLKDLTFGTEASGSCFLDWHQQDGTLFTAVRLDGSGEVRTFLAPSHFSYHFGNCFESEDWSEIIFDASVYDDLESLDRLYLKGPKADATKEIPPSCMVRWRLPLAKGGRDEASALRVPMARPAIDPDAIGRGFEFPSVHPAYRGRRNRYTWAVCGNRPTRFLNALCKVDAETGEARVWSEWGALPGEPCFVPRPGGTAEDDGAVLSLVTGADGQSFMVVLDAASMEELARCSVPYAVPYMFHGSWFGSF